MKLGQNEEEEDKQDYTGGGVRKKGCKKSRRKLQQSRCCQLRYLVGYGTRPEQSSKIVLHPKNRVDCKRLNKFMNNGLRDNGCSRASDLWRCTLKRCPGSITDIVAKVKLASLIQILGCSAAFIFAQVFLEKARIHHFSLQLCVIISVDWTFYP